MGSNFRSPPAKRSISALPDPNHFSPNGSSKRAKSSKARQPLAIPPGHVAFRLLCNASRIGGVIGKSGSVIKSLQQSTGAKIRIGDATNESPDRVITVVASSSVDRKVMLRSHGGDGEAIEVSNAQEALLKIFDRILEVAAESEGIELGDRIVSCRLVVDDAQAGSVIGKGGKVVEKIKKDTGCKIRVCRDNLPACISYPDEMIEIEGSVSSIKKALVVVSRRLQDCHHADRTTIGKISHEVIHHEALGGIPREALNSVPRETFVRASREIAVPRKILTDMHVNHLLQRGSAPSTLPSSSNSYATGIHSLSAEVNRVSSLEPKARQQEITFKIICSSDRIGGIIGKGGNIVKALQSETGASISIGPSIAECDDRLITISASESPESRYSPAQKAVVLVFSMSVESGIKKGINPGLNKGSSVNARLVVSSSQVGCLLGKGGVIVSEMRKATGASIRIVGSDQVSKCASDNDQVVQISGEFSNVQEALYNATGRLRDNLFGGTQNSAGIRSLSLVRSDTSPYGMLRDVPLGGQSSLKDDSVPYVRLRDVSLVGQSSLQADTSPYVSRLRDVPLGGQSSLQSDTSPYVRQRDVPLGGQSSLQADTSPFGRLRDVPLGGQSAVGISHSLSRHTFSQGIDHFALSRNYDRPSFPILWTPERVAGINSGSTNEASWGLPSRKGSLELVSGSKSAIVTNTTIEIVVPEDTLYLVYGENGSNLARLRQISGAKVVIREPHPGTSDRTIVLSGSHDETQAAQSLLQTFILNGSL